MIIVQFSWQSIRVLTMRQFCKQKLGASTYLVFEFQKYPLSQHQISCTARAKTIYLKVRQERVLRFDPGHHNIRFYYYFPQSNKWPISLKTKNKKRGRQVGNFFRVFSKFFLVIDRVILPLFFCQKWDNQAQNTTSTR